MRALRRPGCGRVRPDPRAGRSCWKRSATRGKSRRWASAVGTGLPAPSGARSRWPRRGAKVSRWRVPGRHCSRAVLTTALSIWSLLANWTIRYVEKLLPYLVARGNKKLRAFESGDCAGTGTRWHRERRRFPKRQGMPLPSRARASGGSGPEPRHARSPSRSARGPQPGFVPGPMLTGPKAPTRSQRISWARRSWQRTAQRPRSPH